MSDWTPQYLDLNEKRKNEGKNVTDAINGQIFVLRQLENRALNLTEKICNQRLEKTEQTANYFDSQEKHVGSRNSTNCWPFPKDGDRLSINYKCLKANSRKRRN